MKKTALLLVFALLFSFLFSCREDEKVDTPPAEDEKTPEIEEPYGACTYSTTRDITGRDITYVKITVKDYGEITLLLDGTTAPKTVANFKKLISEGFYNGLTFHRVMENFMIQGGDPKADGTGNSDETIKGEFAANGHPNDISHLRGVISMARRGSYSAEDNYGYDSASCQFFICNADATHLDGDYAAFGYVINGLSVVDKITEATAKYAADYGTIYCNGMIETKSLQPVIEKIEIIPAPAA